MLAQLYKQRRLSHLKSLKYSVDRVANCYKSTIFTVKNLIRNDDLVSALQLCNSIKIPSEDLRYSSLSQIEQKAERLQTKIHIRMKKGLGLLTQHFDPVLYENVLLAYI